MEKDLKAQNIRLLTAIYGGALLLVLVIHWSVEEVLAFSLQLGRQALIVTVITGFGAVLSNMLPNTLKHSLVYFRVRNVLSGHRCRRICTKDPRLSVTDLQKRWPLLFAGEMNESQQNVYWYREIYQCVRNEPEVAQAHRDFLLFRDAAAGLFLLLAGLLLWKAMSNVVDLPSVSTWSLLLLAVIVLSLCLAARQSGNRMVVNAVSVALNG